MVVPSCQNDDKVDDMGEYDRVGIGRPTRLCHGVVWNRYCGPCHLSFHSIF